MYSKDPLPLNKPRKKNPQKRPLSTSCAKKRAFQAYIANVEQKHHVMSLFRLEMIIFETSEGCSGPKNDYFGQTCAFWAQKGPFLGLMTVL
jgi:hypothetical protein